jgi:GAF domain-containing protein
MRRGTKPSKAKVESKRPAAPKPPMSEDARVRDLEERLAEALKREAEAQEQQTATAEILRVISSSPTDVQPVFEVVLASGVRLCGASFGGVFRFDGELIHLVTSHQWPAEQLEAMRGRFPMPPGDGSLAARAIRDCDVVQTPDYVADSRAGVLPEWVPGGEHRPRSTIAIPMQREGRPLGAIVLARAEPGLFSGKHVALLKTFADQAVIAVENVRLFNETKEALEQQTATAEILRVIASSPTELQPVLDSIATNAALVCDAYDAVVFLREGDHVRYAAHYGPIPITVQHTTLSRDSVLEAAILDRQPVHVHDLLATEPPAFPLTAKAAREGGFRTCLSVPLLRENEAIGALSIRRREVQPFTTQQIDLLKTFADQAVIAIENVRLFKELQASNRELTTALEQQTATSDILKVISSSPTDVQPVFKAIVRAAVRLCGGLHGVVDRFDGELIHFVAEYNYTPEALQMTQRMYPRRPDRKQAAGRAILTGDVVNIADVQADPEYATDLAVAGGWRSVLNVPMLREGKPIGTIGVIREQVGRFSDAQVELLRTFADQAVIAIENVRLFTELQEKNKALTQAHAQVTESLEQQMATSEVLQVISRSAFDLQPVLETLVASATRLCNADRGFIFRLDGDVYHLAVAQGATPDYVEFIRNNPIRPGPDTLVGRTALERQTVHIPDVLKDPEYRWRESQQRGHFRTMLGVPMLREGSPIGVIAIWREEVQPFSKKQIELVTTFADQAVIAIENVRLFKELEARTQDLTRSVRELRALGDVSRAITSTLDLQTILTTIVSRAVELSNGSGGVIYEYDRVGTVFELRAVHHLDPEVMALQQSEPIRIGEGAVGRAVAIRAPVQISDLRETQHFAARARVRELLIARGYLSVLAVPLLVEDEILGALVVLRQEASELSDETVELMKTFATQSALAIQNARLFREIEQKSRELEAASRHKSEFLANMSHELRTPLNAIIGFSEVLSERMFGDLNDKQEEYLKDIHASGQHLLSLINDILDLSKIEAGRMELELSDFDLPMAIDNALTLVRERATRRGIALHTAVDERLGQTQADERKIRQVLLNLLSNAIKFTPEGGRIDVHAVPRDGMVEVSVTDTGVGIAPEDQEAVFEEFKQVGTADKKVEGTGLGLALSRKFIELHGGTIWVESQVGAGSTFTFTVPVRRGE